MSWTRPRSLQARQLLAASLGLIAFLALAGYALDRAFVDTAHSNLRQRLKSYALAYAEGIEFLRAGSLYVPDTPPDPRLERPGSGLYVEIVLPDPDAGWQSKSMRGPQLPEGEMLEPTQETFIGPLQISELDGGVGQVYRFGYGLVGSKEEPIPVEYPYTIYVMEDTSALNRQLQVFRRALWGYLGGAGVILLLLQMVVLRWSLRPLHRVVSELSRVQRGLASRLSERHPRELELLTDSINAFIESERENLDRQRHTLADLAHSLKTPLAVLRARLDNEATEAELREEVDLQVRRMSELVSYQLSRAVSGGHALFAAPLAIESHAEAIVRGLEKIYTGKGVLCEFDVDAQAAFHGELGDLQELLGNLLENAFKWADKRVLLSAKPGETLVNRRPGLWLAIDDDGPGIAPEQVERLLQRGIRGDERVQGHGIGLAIVQNIVRSYRGTIEVSRSQELGGARFEIRFPPGL